jgi:predicted phosphoribosyltransferase
LPGRGIRRRVFSAAGQAGRSIVVAVPTGHAESVGRIAREADAVYCANVREGTSFAVASAYHRWTNMEEDEVAGLLAARLANKARPEM